MGEEKIQKGWRVWCVLKMDKELVVCMVGKLADPATSDHTHLENTAPFHYFRPMQFESQLQKTDAAIYYYNIIVPDDIVEHFTAKGVKRFICTLNDTERFHCALLHTGDGQRYIIINKALRKKLGLEIGTPVLASIEEDTSEFGMEMPEEFEELLKQDEEGNHYFRQLTPGKQRNLIHMVASVKSPNIKMRRAFVINNHLKIHKGKLDFKQLNVEMKEANQQGL